MACLVRMLLPFMHLKESKVLRFSWSFSLNRSCVYVLLVVHYLLISGMHCSVLAQIPSSQEEDPLADGRVESFELLGEELNEGGSEEVRYDDLPPVKKERKKVRAPFPGYTKKKEYFRSMCVALYKDGRNELIAKIGEKYKGGMVGCAGCKKFFRLLFSQCKKIPDEYREINSAIKKLERNATLLKDGGKQTTRIRKYKPKSEEKKKKGKEEEEEVEYQEVTLEELREMLPKRQLEPRLSVIDAALRFSQALADDSKYIEVHYQSMQYFEEELLKRDEMTESEKVYFDIYTTYLKAPFREYEEEWERKNEIEQRKKDQREREFMFDSHQVFGK
jgi:molybdopterin converting factor small subunit